MNKSEENNNQNQINEEIPRIEKEEDKNDIKIENNNSPEKSQISEIKELKEKVIRLLADMENQRRRFEKEKDEAYDYGGFSFARELLGIIIITW